jgi:hypothetical protein
MTTRTIALAAILTMSSTLVFAQASQGKAGSENGPTSNAPTTQNNGSAGNVIGTKPSAKDASTQGSNTAGAVDKKGDAATPGGTMKK